ncbi:hypothetical protein LOTGIDRAFT_153035 [Lottia gigantea]|uniref:Chitin-binding type-2 domain-containing protein n=1 Tax=Lottia gigantea TaxID=225164 RepID=V4ASU2_LOTGI|nr:hypothetical protein LOTGIDRAFT_153035 [Lottia gigantea]ESO97925.1 hypothetical protein LOTGIDRAFT_153035 [Lottia gigantea]
MSWILYIALSVVLIEFAIGQEVICPSVDGFYPHPVDCDKYYRCVNGEGTEFQCAPETFWSSQTFVCSWKDDVTDCDSSGKRLRQSAYRSSNIEAKKTDNGVDGVHQGTGEPVTLTTEVLVGSDQTTTLATSSNAPRKSRPSTTHSPAAFVASGQSSTTARPDETEAKNPVVTTKLVDQRVSQKIESGRVTPKITSQRATTNYNTEATTNDDHTATVHITDHTASVNVTIVTQKPPQANASSHPVPMKFAARSVTGFRCPKDNGYYPDLDDCSNYYECILGHAYKRKCMVGTLFDRIRHKCTWENLVRDCAKLTTSTDSTTKVTNKIDYNFHCPKPDGYFRSLSDCRVYYHCIDNRALVYQCTPGSLFDIHLGKCTWFSRVYDCNEDGKPVSMDGRKQKEKNIPKKPVKANRFRVTRMQSQNTLRLLCFVFMVETLYGHGVAIPSVIVNPVKRTTVVPPSAVPISVKRETVIPTSVAVRAASTQSTVPNLSSSPSSPKNIGSVFNFACPLPNGHFRDSTNCAIFYHCLSDVPYKGYCRSGHAFDTEMMMCVAASQIAGCAPVSVSTSPTTQFIRQINPQAPENKASPSSLQSALHTYQSVEDHVKSEDTVISYRSFKCPEEEGYFRDAEDCSVYYFCTKWKVFQQQCKPGTVFSMEKLTCTWPNTVDCNTTRTAAPSTIRATDALPILTTASPHRPASRDETRSTNTIRLENPATATNGPTTVIQQRDQDYYDYGYYYDNENEIDNDDDNGDDNKNLPDINSITEAASISFVCPPVFDGYYGDPISCTKFYRCIGGKMYSFSCPTGTFFDNTRYICNFISEVNDCTPNGIRYAMIQQRDEYKEIEPKFRHAHSQQKKVEFIEPKSRRVHHDHDKDNRGESSFDRMPPGFKAVKLPCPLRDGVFGHPKSCTKFIFCKKFIPYVIDCPGDLVYNIHLHTCDYPDNVICKRYD